MSDNDRFAFSKVGQVQVLKLTQGCDRVVLTQASMGGGLGWWSFRRAPALSTMWEDQPGSLGVFVCEQKYQNVEWCKTGMIFIRADPPLMSKVLQVEYDTDTKQLSFHTMSGEVFCAFKVAKTKKWAGVRSQFQLTADDNPSGFTFLYKFIVMHTLTPLTTDDNDRNLADIFKLNAEARMAAVDAHCSRSLTVPEENSGTPSSSSTSTLGAVASSPSSPSFDTCIALSLGGQAGSATKYSEEKNKKPKTPTGQKRVLEDVDTEEKSAKTKAINTGNKANNK